jgi:hypothetical protein
VGAGFTSLKDCPKPSNYFLTRNNNIKRSHRRVLLLPLSNGRALSISKFSIQNNRVLPFSEAVKPHDMTSNFSLGRNILHQIANSTMGKPVILLVLG